MPRLLSILLVVFALLAGPALCTGGLLEHDCDCGQGGAELQCQHEDSCSDDPCASLTVPHEREDRNHPTGFETSRSSVAVVRWGMEIGSARWSWSAISPLPPDRSNLPYAQSDRPLLI